MLPMSFELFEFLVLCFACNLVVLQDTPVFFQQHAPLKSILTEYLSLPPNFLINANYILFYRFHLERCQFEERQTCKYGLCPNAEILITIFKINLVNFYRKQTVEVKLESIK